jgi:hypothetical protein
VGRIKTENNTANPYSVPPAHRGKEEEMAKIRVVHTWADDKLEWDYDDIANFIRDPMYVADSNYPNQEDYIRKHRRSIARAFIARLREAIKIAEREGEEELDGYDLCVWIYPEHDECISFRPSDTFSVNLDTALLRDLIAPKRSRKENDEHR